MTDRSMSTAHRRGQVAERIDSHLHVWELGRSPYSWLRPDMGALYADFSPDDALPALTTAGIGGAILVQADDTDEETDYLLEQAALHPWVVGVVGWAALDDPERARRQLRRRAQNPVFRGVRQLIHNDRRPDVLGQPSVRATLALVADAGYPFEVPDAWPGHLNAATKLARELPSLTVVLDHLGKPPRGRADYPAWSTALARFAELPNTVAKVSGLRMPGTEYNATALRRTWDHALDVFGAPRLMYGGDWPITVPAGGYAPTFAVLDELVRTLGPADQAAIMGGTATRVYRLDHDRAPALFSASPLQSSDSRSHCSTPEM